MISCREWVKPLIIIFKEVNQNQIKNYGGLAVFPFLLPILERIQVSLISAESKLAPPRPHLESHIPFAQVSAPWSVIATAATSDGLQQR